MAVKKKMNVIFKDEEEYQHLIYEIEIIVMYLANSKKLSDSYIDFDNMINEYGDRGCIMFRKNLHTYAKSHQNAHDFRTKVNSMTDPKEMRDSIIDFFSNEKIK